MSTDRSRSAEVEVPVTPRVAFRAFTEEMDLWWVRGPINFMDAARAVAMVCEPGVGGRVLEVYDQASGDVLELARITRWEPGKRLAWKSSVDDVQIEVLFDPIAHGTRVTVTATIDGADHGGTAWLRVVPPWFGQWCAQRDQAARQPRELARLAVAVYYADPIASSRWLAAAFGLAPVRPLPDAYDDYTWIEFHVGNCSLLIFKLDPAGAAGKRADTHVPWLFVDDLAAHFEHAVAHGAVITDGIHQHGYRAYTTRDPEGYHWTVAQARPGMK